MPTICRWVINGRLTSERKASTSPSSFINHSTLLLDRALKRQAPCLYCLYMNFEHSQTGSERVDAWGQRAVEVIICMLTRDFSVISMTSQASLSLSLSLPLTKVTHAQYRKRFRASYNNCFTSYRDDLENEPLMEVANRANCCPMDKKRQEMGREERKTCGDEEGACIGLASLDSVLVSIGNCRLE